MPTNGFIKLHRSITQWEWYKDQNVKDVFLHLLLMANHEDTKWQGIVIKRGQRITSLNHIATEVGSLSVQQVRTALNKLKSTHEITSETTNEYTIITITSYDTYQANNTQNNKRITNEQQTNNKRITTNKNEKNEKNEKNIYITPQDISDIANQLSVPEADVKRCYGELTDYCMAKGRTYKDYKAALRGWVRRKIDDGKIKVFISARGDIDPLVKAMLDKENK